MQHQTFAPVTPHQIEARLEDDRKALTAALNALGTKFTRHALWSNGMSTVKANSGPYAQALDRAISASPLAATLTAVGLAWLVLGRRTSPAAHGQPLPGTQAEAVARWEDEGGPVTESVDQAAGLDAVWIAEADQLRARAAKLTARIDAASRQSMIPTAQLDGLRADVIAALTQDVRGVMARGLDHLPDDARRMALIRRERTYTAHVQRPAGTVRAIKDRPLSTLAVFVAAGAALATLLPQLPAENVALGAPRDQFLDAVRRTLRNERDHLAHTVLRMAQTLLAVPLGPKADAPSAQDHT